MDEEDYELMTSVLVGIIGIILLSILIAFEGDDGDLVDVRAMGSAMCGFHNLSYGYRDYPVNQSYPVIHCVNNTIDPRDVLNDGVLKFEKGRENNG